MLFEYMRTSVSAAILGAGLLLGGTAVAQMTPQQQNGQWGTQSENKAQMSGQESSSQPTVVVDPGKIYNANPMSWVGKSVILKNVTVQDTNDTGNFWVGSDGDHRLLIVKVENDPNLSAMRFHKGDIVTIEGVVQPASKYAAGQTTASSGSMSDAQSSSGVFLLASQISVTSSTQH